MALDITYVYVSERKIALSSTPPAIVFGAPIAGIRYVLFQWNIGSFAYPYYYQYDIKIGSGAYSGVWTDIQHNQLLYTLTAADIVAQGTTPTITIKVRSTDGISFSASVEDSEAPITGGLRDGDVDPLDKYTESALAAAVIAKLHSTTDTLAQGTVKFYAGESGADVTATHTSLDTAKVNNVAAATVQGNASDGKTGYDKIIADVGSNTLESTAGSQTKVNSRLSSTEKSNLEGALGSTLTVLSPTADDILLVGTHGTVAGLKTTIKTDLALNNVENKSGATILTDGLATAVIANGKIPIVNGVNDNIIALISASVESTKLASADIKELAGSKVKNDGLTVALFNSSGNFLGSIYSGTTTITAANIISAISSAGLAKNLDLSSIATGNLDNIGDGATYKRVTANEKTGSGWAYSALNSTSKLTTGTTNYTVAEIERNVKDIHSRNTQLCVNAAGLTDFVVVSVTGSGALLNVIIGKFKKASNDVYLTFRCRINPGDTLGKLVLTLLDEAGTESLGSTQVNIDTGAGAYYYYTVQHDVSGLIVGTWYRFFVGINGTSLKTYDLKDYGWSVNYT